MKKQLFKKILMSLFLVQSLSAFANEDWGTLKKSVFLIGEGGVKQFQTKSNLYALPLATATLWYSFENDKRNSAKERSKKMSDLVKSTESMSILFNFPLIPISAYYLGKYNQNEKMIQFGLETFSSLYLALVESAAISLIPIHDRPDTSRVNKWETNFRGDSSFPSGHVIPFAVLAFKSFQFYGPYAAILPAALTYLSSKQRIQDGKHYLSDVVGAVWLSYFASEGVRLANGFNNNHEVYKKYFEPTLEVGVTLYQNVIGPKVVWSY